MDVSKRYISKRLVSSSNPRTFRKDKRNISQIKTHFWKKKWRIVVFTYLNCFGRRSTQVSWSETPGSDWGMFDELLTHFLHIHILSNVVTEMISGADAYRSDPKFSYRHWHVSFTIWSLLDDTNIWPLAILFRLKPAWQCCNPSLFVSQRDWI